MRRWDLVAALLVAALLVAALLLPRTRGAPQDAWLVDFYPAEGGAGLRYSFSRPTSHAFLPDLPPRAAALVLRVRSPQPLPTRVLTLTLNGTRATSVRLDAQPRTLRLLLPPLSAVHSAGMLIGLHTSAAKAPADTRALGMLFESVATQPLEDSPNHALALVLVAFALLLGGAWLVTRLRSIRPSALALALLCVVWAGVFSFYASANHQLYRSNTYDLGHFDQSIWLISRGATPYSTGMGLHVLGDHAALLLYPLALLYVAAADVRALLAFQSVAIALGAVPLFLLSRRRGHPALGLLVAAAYLLHPATQNLALFDFHPDALAGAALLWAVWAFERRRWPLLYACCAAMLFAKENFAITVALFGVWIMALHSRRLAALRGPFSPHGLAILLLSALWFVAATRWLLPSLNGQAQSLHLLERYSQYGDSPAAIARTLLLRPALVITALLESESLRYLWQLAAPFGLLCLLGPRFVVLALPALLLNLLSAAPEQRTLLYQYNALIVPALAGAALHGVLLLQRSALVVRRSSLVVLLLGIVYAQLALPLRVRETASALVNPSDRLRYYDYAVSLVPPDASVSAQAMLQPHLAQRRQTYLFPNPFRPAVFFNPAQMPYTASAAYILYDTRRPDDLFVPSGEKLALLDTLRAGGSYETLLDLDGVLVLRLRR